MYDDDLDRDSQNNNVQGTPVAQGSPALPEPVPVAVEPKQAKGSEELPDGEILAAKGRLERLEARVQELLRDSADSAFSEYLRQVRARVINQQYQIDLLADELDRNYRKFQAVGPAKRPDQQSDQQPVQRSDQRLDQQLVQRPPAQDAAVPAAPGTSEVMPAAQQEASQAGGFPAQPKGPSKNNLEFTIGAAVLSIVGSVFILIALVLLGINFLNGFVRGLSLYAICLAVMALSELLLYKRWPKLGMTFSAISMGGLYLSTLLNYLWLDNFNMWVAFGLTCLITVGVILLSRKRDAGVYRILGMAAVYVCILMLPAGGMDPEGGVSQSEFLAVTAILFLINVMCLLVPVRRAYTAVNVIHMALNTLFTMIVCVGQVIGNSWSDFTEIWHYPVFVAVSLLVVQMIFIFQVRQQAKQKPEGGLRDSAGICTAYGICAFFYGIMTALSTDFTLLTEGLFWDRSPADVYMVHRLVCAAVVGLICAVPIIALRRRQEKWLSWYLMNLLLLAIYVNAADPWEKAWCLTALLVIAKLLSFTKSPMPRVGDAVLTTIACIAVAGDADSVHVLPLVAVLLLGVLCLNGWKTYFEAILTYAIAIYTSAHMLPMLKLPVFVGILFAGMLLFNNVERWKDKGIVIYNYLMLAGQAVCYLQLLNPVYRNAYLTYLCMLIFGLTTIVICFQENYGMDFRFKQMILVVFLTYMALVMRTGYPVINSILLMVTALVAVGMGFAERRKSVRIYGLALSLADCGKIVLYDFYEAPVLQKTIVFFVVGVLALAISAIYMVLEKKQGKTQADAEKEMMPEEEREVL